MTTVTEPKCVCDHYHCADVCGSTDEKVLVVSGWVQLPRLPPLEEVWVVAASLLAVLVSEHRSLIQPLETSSGLDDQCQTEYEQLQQSKILFNLNKWNGE